MERRGPEFQPTRGQQHVDDGVLAVFLLLSIVFFALVNEALKWASRHYVALKMTSQWRWRNLAVSWVHADFCAIGCLYHYAVYGHQVRSLSDLLDLQPASAFFLVAFCTGYFLFDMMDYILSGRLKASWEVIAHHVAVIAIFGYNLLNHAFITFSVLALTVEVNSVFLHARKLMQMLQVPFSHWLYRLTSTLNLASFVLFRGPPLVLIWMGIIFHSDRMSRVYYIMLSSVMVFMVILNPVLFWRLLKNDVFRRNQPTRKMDSEPKRNTEDQARNCVDREDRKTRGSETVPEQNGSMQNGGCPGGVGGAPGDSTWQRSTLPWQNGGLDTLKSKAS